MEHTGLEPVTSTLPVWRAPNCANAPRIIINTKRYYTIFLTKWKRKMKNLFSFLLVLRYSLLGRSENNDK